MDLRDSTEDAAFRQEVRAWIAEHRVGQFAESGGVGGPGVSTRGSRSDWPGNSSSARRVGPVSAGRSSGAAVAPR